jgi:hypothetical protein
MNENPLRYLILFEGGAVALLATALDRHDNTEPSKSQSAFWRGFAEQCNLPLSDSGPSKVALEYDGADLIVIWDNWAILVEAKIDDKSIRRGQLQKYYQKFRPQLGRNDLFHDASSMAIVFLTPSFSQAAKQEFDELDVSGGDQKQPLQWEEILSLLKGSFSTTQNEQREEQMKFLSSLILQGADQIAELLRKGVAPGPMAVEWNPDRRRCRDFAKDIQGRVRELWHEVHFNPVWSDTNADEITANFGSNPTGNLSFDIFPDSRIFEDDSEYSELHGKLFFKLAGRPSADLKTEFSRVVKQNLEALLRVKEIKIDLEAFKVSLPITQSQSRSELCDHIAGLFCTWLIVFRPLMVSDKGRDAI